MKTKSFAVVASGTAVAVLWLAGACFLQTSKAQTESIPPPAPDGSTAAVVPDESAALPPNIDPNSALAQIVKLVQSGVSQDVIMAYVTNSTGMFKLDPDEIIYLKDIGAPDELVTAMMQRDQMLQAQTAAGASYLPPQPAAPATETAASEPVPAATVVEPAAPVTVDYFYGTLAPYGSWVYVSGYGRCWRPTVTVVNAGWQPYCDHGHWVWTDCGWYWISDYSWGWAPFHYGRWFCDAHLGWCWYPDTAWGPSWVTWRYSPGYCGWAPLPPHAVYRAGVGFFYNGAAVSVGFNFGLGVSAYTFVPTGSFCDPHPWHYRVAPRDVAQIYNNTTVINNFNEDGNNHRFINHGIDPGRITAVTHREIQPVAIHETVGRVLRGEQLGRDGHTLYVNRPQFSDNPAPPNRGGAPRSPTAPPPVGSAYQGQGIHNGNPPSPRGQQPAPAAPPPPNPGIAPHTTPSRPAMGSAYQGTPDADQNNRPLPTRNNQPVAATSPSGQRQYPPPTASAPPGRSQATTVQSGPSPGYNHAPVPPLQPQPPNYNSTDNRRYPTPRMQQNEPPKPAVQAPPQPQQHSYVPPRAEPSPGGSHASNYQPPATDNQPSSGSFARSPAPAPSPGSGHGRNQHGQ